MPAHSIISQLSRQVLPLFPRLERREMYIVAYWDLYWRRVQTRPKKMMFTMEQGLYLV